MCGILSIINKSNHSAGYLVKSNTQVAHRGPDDEGYLLWSENTGLNLYCGTDTSHSTRQTYNYEDINPSENNWTVGLAHRRLSIIDLSPTGHQPMVLQPAEMSITYNGEIYNYVELREELKSLGCMFHTNSDTEVILQAWAMWGANCLDKFNGMFSFVILDTKRQKLYAVRDRFGVKPLYYTDCGGYTAFASEVKQLRVLPEYKFSLNTGIAYDYLQFGLVDHEEETFESGIFQIPPGHLMECDLATGSSFKRRWYELVPKIWKGTEQEACEHLVFLLKDSVRLRMRSDVPVGAALSGGLDSSTIVCLMREVLHNQGVNDHLIKTITSCQEDKKYDEWEFAEEVIRHVKAKPYRVFPTFDKLREDLDKLLWHMDYPCGSTSQFSQWCVFEGAKKQGITVMIDGQGADEQLAGYGGNDVAMYAGLMKRGKFYNMIQEARSYKQRIGNWPIGILLGAMQTSLPWVTPLFPESYRILQKSLKAPAWLKTTSRMINHRFPMSLQDGLMQQIQRQPLPSLLRYEDRNSMAFSVESRVPFMDYRLIEFTLGLPENLIFRKGDRKYILRKAFRGEVPEKVLNRTDKMGFVSPEERWLKQDGADWFQMQIDQSIHNSPDYFNQMEAKRFYNDIKTNKAGFSFEPWRIICFNQFLKQRNG